MLSNAYELAIYLMGIWFSCIQQPRFAKIGEKSDPGFGSNLYSSIRMAQFGRFHFANVAAWHLDLAAILLCIGGRLRRPHFISKKTSRGAFHTATAGHLRQG